MKQLSRMMTVAAAAMLVAAPAAAAPVPGNPAASLSLSKAVRTGAPAAGHSRLAGANGGLVIALGVGVAIIVAIIIAGSEGSKYPTSN